MRGASSELAVYVEPDPETVARIWDSYGDHSACERWFWVKSATLAKIAQKGRAIQRCKAGIAPVARVNRSTTPEQDAAVVAAARRAESISEVMAATGLSNLVVHRILREAGVAPPTVDRLAVMRRSAENRRRNAA